MQAEPNLEGAVAVDHRGERYALGRTADAYAVWSLSGGPAVRTFPQQEQHWAEAWQAFQELEAGRDAAAGSTPAEQPATATAGPAQAGSSHLEGLVVMDYQGSRFGAGRTRDAYAIWDLSRGGAPIETHPLSEVGWQVTWRRYQELESGAPATGPVTPTDVPAEAPSVTATQPEAGPAAAPVEATSEPAPGPDLQGAAAVDYRGRAYALGRTANGYAIWDVATGGQPILTFPSTPEAWNQAWGAYQRLEGPGGG